MKNSFNVKNFNMKKTESLVDYKKIFESALLNENVDFEKIEEKIMPYVIDFKKKDIQWILSLMTECIQQEKTESLRFLMNKKVLWSYNNSEYYWDPEAKQEVNIINVLFNAPVKSQQCWDAAWNIMRKDVYLNQLIIPVEDAALNKPSMYSCFGLSADGGFKCVLDELAGKGLLKEAKECLIFNNDLNELDASLAFYLALKAGQGDFAEWLLETKLITKDTPALKEIPLKEMVKAFVNPDKPLTDWFNPPTWECRVKALKISVQWLVNDQSITMEQWNPLRSRSEALLQTLSYFLKLKKRFKPDVSSELAHLFEDKKMSEDLMKSCREKMLILEFESQLKSDKNYDAEKIESKWQMENDFLKKLEAKHQSIQDQINDEQFKNITIWTKINDLIHQEDWTVLTKAIVLLPKEMKWDLLLGLLGQSLWGSDPSEASSVGHSTVDDPKICERDPLAWGALKLVMMASRPFINEPIPGMNGLTLVHLATILNHKEVLSELIFLKGNFNPNPLYNTPSPLSLAIQFNYDDLAAELLKNGAHPLEGLDDLSSMGSHHRQWAIHEVIQKKKWDLMAMMVDQDERCLQLKNIHGETAEEVLLKVSYKNKKKNNKGYDDDQNELSVEMDEPDVDEESWSSSSSSSSSSFVDEDNGLENQTDLEDRYSMSANKPTSMRRMS